MKSKTLQKTNNKTDLIRIFSLLGIVAVQFCFFVYRRGTLKLMVDWQSLALSLNYRDYGLIRRGFMGEIAMRLAALFRVEYSYSFISHFQLVSVLLFTLTVFVGFFCFIKKVDKESRDACFLLTLVLICFGGVSYYYLDWAIQDIYMIALTLVSVSCAMKGRLLFLIPINCALCSLIHEGYPMMFFFIVMAILFYRWMSTESSLVNKYSVVLLISGLITTALFVYFYFFSSCKEGVTLDDMDRRSVELTGVTQRQNIEYLFFHGDSPICGFWINGRPTLYFVRNVINIGIVLLMYAPVLWTMWRIQLRTLKNAATVKDRLKYVVCFGGFALVIPLFIVHTDTGRWLHDFFWYEFLITVFLLIARDSFFSKEVRNVFQNKTFVVFLLVPYFFLNFNMDKEWMYRLTYECSNAVIQLLVDVKHLIF